MKICNTCEQSLSLSCFNKAAANTGGYMYLCKTCELAYRRTYKARLGIMYKSQKSNSKNRSHPAPNYSLADFIEWAEKNGYASIHAVWEASAFSKNLTPSADRLNDDLPYSLDNIRLVTWKENNDKGHTDFVSGKLQNKHTAVRQLTKDGACVAVYVSQLAAHRATGVSQGNIGIVCRKTGRRKTAGGFKWEYVNEGSIA